MDDDFNITLASIDNTLDEIDRSMGIDTRRPNALCQLRAIADDLERKYLPEKSRPRSRGKLTLMKGGRDA